jgi:hypothetical protein
MVDVLPDGNRWTSRVQVGTVARGFEVSAGEPYQEVDSCSMTVRVVCSTCNSGWMSRLESDVRPALAPLLVGDSVEVEPISARVIARWCVKTALVLAAAAGRPWTPDAVTSAALRSGALPAAQIFVAVAVVPEGLDGWTQVVNVSHGGCSPNGALFVDAVRGAFAFSAAVAPNRGALPGWSVLMPHGWASLLTTHKLRPLPGAEIAEVISLGIARTKLLDMTRIGKLGPL